MKRGLNSTVICGVAVALIGCTSLKEQKLGENLKKSETKVRVKLLGAGQIFVAQKFQPRVKCQSLFNALSVSVQGEAGTRPVTMQPTCDFLKGNLVYISKEMQKPGTFMVQVTKKSESARLLTGQPMVAAKFEDADFNSGADFIVQGAKDLAAGQIAKGFITYPEGNMTDWIKVAGKNGATSLTLVDGSDNKDLVVQVYDMSRGPRAPRRLGSLTHKKTRTFPMKSDNLYVRVKGEGYSAEGAYSIIRGDAASVAVSAGGGGGGGRLSVIDCYRVGDGESVVLLEASEGLKVSDEIVVFGRAVTGELQQLGECEVTAVQSGQASCRMSGQVDNRFTEYRATKKSGST